MKLRVAGFLLLWFPSVVASAQDGFSQDSAFAILRILSVDIGPRPMGSPAEQRAIEFAVGKLREAGCPEAYVMPVTVAEGVNTQSGVAVGVLPGRSGRIIIIGGHIDSSGPDVPGTNDDGSGTACVLELARVLCKRQHESTLMFCCWGGEEQGPVGSKYFVRHFRDIDSVDLMLQIDMADGASWLEVDPDYLQTSAPRWLTAAAYQVFYDELHSRGLVYPTASAAINSAFGGVAGSDHDPFLEKGIPAIDFTSDVDYPIHTPQDNLANFTPSGLKRSGDLVLKLVDRFDHGVPSRTTERYMLIQLGIKTLFLDIWMLRAIVAVGLLLALLAFFMLYGRRRVVPGLPGRRWSGVKLVVYTAVIQGLIWLSEAWMGSISGHRFPWADHFDAIVVLGVLFGLVGLWLVLNIAGHFRLSQDPFVFGWRSLVLLVIMTLVSARGGPKLAVFFGAVTGLMSLAFIIRSTAIRLLCWLLSCLTMLRLIFFEELGLIQRELTNNTIHTFWGLIGYEFIFIFLFTLISLPFTLGFAALYRDSLKDLFWLRRFREKRGLVPVVPAIALVVAFLLMHPPYGPTWQSYVAVHEDCGAMADSCTVTVRSSEYFDGLTVVSDTGALEFDDRANFLEFKPPRLHTASLCTIDTRLLQDQDSTRKDSTLRITRYVSIRSKVRPFKVQVRYDSELPFTVASPWAYRSAGRSGDVSDRGRIFSWYSYPDTVLEIPVTFTLRDTQRVSEKIEVIFDTLAYPLRLSRELTDFEKRTRVTESHEFRVSDASPPTASPLQ